MKIKINLDNDLLFEKILNMYDVVVTYEACF